MKDPAFLFYPSDFLTGTLLMSKEQIGKYIILLCLQHSTGHLTEKDMLKICETRDEDIFCKFEKDDAGFYFNKRLDEEKNRRIAYSNSRSANRTKNIKHINNISETHKRDMETITITINETINNNKGVVEKKLIHTGKEINEAWQILKNSKHWRSKSINALNLTVGKLNAASEDIALQMVNNAIEGGWKGVFAISESKQQKQIKKAGRNEISEIDKFIHE